MNTINSIPINAHKQNLTQTILVYCNALRHSQQRTEKRLKNIQKNQIIKKTLKELKNRNILPFRSYIPAGLPKFSQSVKDHK